MGESLPPCSCFTLTLVAERTAVLFGGVSGAEFLNDLFVVELSRLSVVINNNNNNNNFTFTWFYCYMYL